MSSAAGRWGLAPKAETENYQAPASAPRPPSPASSHSLPSAVSRTSIAALGEPLPDEVGLVETTIPSRGVPELEEGLDERPDDLAGVASPGLATAGRAPG